MNQKRNPYDPPTATGQTRAKSAINGRLFLFVNIGLVCALAMIGLASFLWAKFEDAQVQQQLGGRYATYDHEYEFYPISGLIVLALFFVVPNLILVVVQLARSRTVG